MYFAPPLSWTQQFKLKRENLEPWGWELGVMMVVLDYVIWSLELHCLESSCCMVRIRQKRKLHEIWNAKMKKPLISKWCGSSRLTDWSRTVQKFQTSSLSSWLLSLQNNINPEPIRSTLITSEVAVSTNISMSLPFMVLLWWIDVHSCLNFLENSKLSIHTTVSEYCV